MIPKRGITELSIARSPAAAAPYRATQGHASLRCARIREPPPRHSSFQFDKFIFYPVQEAIIEFTVLLIVQ
jgi:hypothetical protein